jgi:hypothetical protein
VFELLCAPRGSPQLLAALPWARRHVWNPPELLACDATHKSIYGRWRRCLREYSPLESAVTSRNARMKRFGCVMRFGIIAMLSLTARAQNSDREADSASVARAMNVAAQRLLAASDPVHRSSLLHPLDLELRTDWHYTPRSRAGVPLKDMSPLEREAARRKTTPSRSSAIRPPTAHGAGASRAITCRFISACSENAS